MDAQLRWLISSCWQDVDFIDTSARSQSADNAFDAGICSIGHPGQDKRNIELRFFLHADYPSIISMRSAGNPGQPALKGEWPTHRVDTIGHYFHLTGNSAPNVSTSP